MINQTGTTRRLTLEEVNAVARVQALKNKKLQYSWKFWFTISFAIITIILFISFCVVTSNTLYTYQSEDGKIIMSDMDRNSSILHNGVSYVRNDRLDDKKYLYLKYAFFLTGAVVLVSYLEWTYNNKRKYINNYIQNYFNTGELKDEEVKKI